MLDAPARRVALPVTASLFDVASALRETRATCAAITDAAGRLVGLCSETDVLRGASEASEAALSPGARQLQ